MVTSLNKSTFKVIWSNRRNVKMLPSFRGQLPPNLKKFGEIGWNKKENRFWLLLLHAEGSYRALIMYITNHAKKLMKSLSAKNISLLLLVYDEQMIFSPLLLYNSQEKDSKHMQRSLSALLLKSQSNTLPSSFYRPPSCCFNWYNSLSYMEHFNREENTKMCHFIEKQ
jgi:hypothetical protein